MSEANDLLGLFAEGGSRPACRLTFLLVQESKQRTQSLLPPSRRLCLRATCVVKLLRLCGPTHFAASRFAQTNGGKFDDDAAALCGATARPKHLPSQAGANGAIPDAG